MRIADERVYQACEALKRGWRPIPLQGKRPVMSGWQAAEFPSEAQVTDWAASGNYGIVTGEPGGIVVLDVDDSKFIEPMMEKYPTITALTGRGCHLYFKTPAVPVKNAVGLAEGVDFRGVGGQVVGVASVHPEHGGIYRWAPQRAPGQIALAELPPHILDRLRKDKPASGQEIPVAELPDDIDIEAIDTYARVALSDEIKKLKACGTGGRNHALNVAAFNLGQLVGAGRLPRGLVVKLLLEACAANGLLEEDSEWQCLRTIESGLNSGTAAPREPKPTAQRKSEPEADAAVGDDEIDIVYLDDPALEATPPRWFVPNLIRKDGFHLIWAQPGGYKTSITIRVLLELLTHQEEDKSHHLLGNPDWHIKEGIKNALIITTEEQPTDLKDVLQKNERGYGTVLPDRKSLMHIYAHQVRRDEPITINSLRPLVDKYGPFDMVVLDSLTGLRPKHTNVQWDVDNEAANKMCLMLRRFIAERGMALWVIHHSDKLVKNYRGPTEWWASADVMFGLLKHHDKGTDTDLIKVLPQKVRGGRVLPPLFLEPVWTEGKGGLSLRLAPFQKGGALEKELADLLDRIEADSNDDDGVSLSALEATFEGSKRTLQRHINKLVDKSLVQKITRFDLPKQPVFLRKI